MNYLYKTIDNEIIVSEEEHQKILEAQKQGKNVIYLRNGKLMINLNFVGYVKETDELTDEQLKQKQELLRLPPEKETLIIFLLILI